MNARRRRAASGAAGWIFGLASTVLLVGLWGRAVVVDTDQLADSLTPLATSQIVADRFSSWLEQELAQSGVEGPTASGAADEVLAHPAAAPMLEELVVQGVAAAASDDPSGSTVDVASILLPSVGQITTGLNDAGVPVSTSQVESALADLDPLVIRDPAEDAMVGPSSPLASSLGTAALLAILVMTMSGWAYVASAPDGMAALRCLLTRFALGAVSFAVILKLGSWILDPEGGRAPVGESLALVADSKWLVPLTLGGVSLCAAAIVRLFRRRIRPAAASRSRSGRPIPPGTESRAR